MQFIHLFFAAQSCEVAFSSAGWLFVYHALCLLDNRQVLLPLLIAGCLVVLASCGVVLPLFTGDFCGCIILSFLLAGCLVLSFSVGVLKLCGCIFLLLLAGCVHGCFLCLLTSCVVVSSYFTGWLFGLYSSVYCLVVWLCHLLFTGWLCDCIFLLLLCD